MDIIKKSVILFIALSMVSVAGEKKKMLENPVATIIMQDGSQFMAGVLQY